MTEKISIVNASDYQIFPGDGGGSMMVEDEFQPDREEDPPNKKIKTELDSEAKETDSLLEKVIHIDTRYALHSLPQSLMIVLQVRQFQAESVRIVSLSHSEQ